MVGTAGPAVRNPLEGRLQRRPSRWRGWNRALQWNPRPRSHRRLGPAGAGQVCSQANFWGLVGWTVRCPLRMELTLWLLAMMQFQTATGINKRFYDWPAWISADLFFHPNDAARRTATLPPDQD